LGFYELDDTWEVRVEVLNIGAELRSECKRSKPQSEREDVRNGNDQDFPLSSPVQGIVWVVARLWDENGALGPCLLDEMMGPEIGHNFGSWQDLNMKLFLELTELLLIVNVERLSCHHFGVCGV
jgi:hypothetical protein